MIIIFNNIIKHSAHFGVFVILLALLSGSVYASVQEASTSNIESDIESVCGNGIVELSEQCDTGEFNGPCPVICSTSCTTNSCGGGGGGGGGGVENTVTGAIFSGRAYPKSTVTLLKDAQVVATTVAGTDANFKITLSGISGGNYIFSIYSEDNKDIRSSLLTFPVSITSGVTTNVGGIFLAPTILVDKSEVKKGDNIIIFGQSAPSSEITISVNSDEEFFVKKMSDTNGVYLLNFDTSVLEMGQHHTKSKASLKEEISSFSKTVEFKVGTKNVDAVVASKCPVKANLNSDCRVNLVDFSIAAYWYKRFLSAPFGLIEKGNLNGDGKIDLVDFSIMAYYWTG